MSAKSVQIELKRMHAGQARVFRDPARLKVALMARRFGKTDGGIIWIIEGAVKVDFLVRGENLETLYDKATGEPLTTKGACAWFSPTYKLLDEAWRDICRRLAPIITRKDSQQKRIELLGGGSIDFWTMDNDMAGRGRKYHRVFIDEAGVVKDFENVFWGAIYPTTTDYGGDIVIAGTPKGRRGFYRIYEMAKQEEKGMKAFTAKTIDNPYIDREEVALAKSRMPIELFKQEYEAEPAEDGGNPFGLKAIANAVDQMGEGPAVCYGVDLARSVDWTVLIGLNQHGQMCEYERFQKPWRDTRWILAEKIGNTPALVDSTGVGSPIVEDLQASCPGVQGFVFSSTSKQQIMEGLTAAFQTSEIRITDDPILVNELESFGVEFNNGRVRYEAPSGMHDDCVCALALAWDCYKKHGGAASDSPLVVFSRPFGARRDNRGIRACL